MNLKPFFAALAGVMLIANSASAGLITFGGYGVGSWTPSNEFNSDNDILLGVNRSVGIWNGTAPQGLYTVGNDSATFTKGAGTQVPASLPAATAYVNRFEGDFNSFNGLNNSAGGYSYLVAKYGNIVAQVFYIGNLQDSAITVPLNYSYVEVKNGREQTKNAGLSHISWLSGPPPSVPDGGLTAMLLALGLSGLGAARRFGKK